MNLSGETMEHYKKFANANSNTYFNGNAPHEFDDENFLKELDQKNAIIIDRCDSESVEKAIRTALQLSIRDRDRMSKAARETAVNNFDYRIYSETLLGMIMQ